MMFLSQVSHLSKSIFGFILRSQPLAVVAWMLLFLVCIECSARLLWDPRVINRDMFRTVGPANDYGFVIPGPVCRRIKEKLICYSGEHNFVYQQKLTAKRSEEIFRIGVVGESHSNGRRSFGAFISKKLNVRCKGVTFETMNLSTDGYGTRRIQVMLDELLQYEPSIVLVNPGGTNEYEDERDFQVRSELDSGIWSVVLRSHAVVLFDKLFEYFFKREDLEAVSEETVDIEREESRVRKNLLRWEGGFQKNVEEMTQRLEKENIPALLVGRAEYRARSNRKRFKRRERLNAIIKSSASDRVIFFDAHSAFPTRKRKRRRMFQDDRNHYSRRGHALLAEKMLPTVVDLLELTDKCKVSTQDLAH